MRRPTRTAAFAATMLTLALGVTALPTSASAQTRAALVQDTDEPGRNPYQVGVFKFCSGTNHCTFTFPAVPAGMRLVVTHVSTAIAITNGTPPLGVLSLNTDTNTSAGVYFTASRIGPASPGTLFVVNQECGAYFEAGDVPLVGLSLTGDTFTGAARMVLSGYYVKLP